MRYFNAIRTASNAASKQWLGERAATIGNGASPWRPYIASRRSACSVFVGSPVDGPPRCTSTRSSGSSRLIARPRPSDLRSTPGPLVRGHRELARERGADRDADRGDLVLRLQRAHTEVLVPRQLVEDVGRGRDRVGRVEQRQVRLLRRGDEPVRRRDVAGDVAVAARSEARRCDLVRVVEQLGRLAEVVAGLERGEVRPTARARGWRTSARSTRSSPRSGACTSTTSARARRSSSSAPRRGASRRAPWSTRA